MLLPLSPCKHHPDNRSTHCLPPLPQCTLIAGACDSVPCICRFPPRPVCTTHPNNRCTCCLLLHIHCLHLLCCALDMPLPLPPVSTTPPKRRHSTHCLSPLLLGTLMYCQVKAVG